MTARAAVYTETGDPDVLQVVDRPVVEPGPGEVRVRIHRSGINPTDWKSRQGNASGTPVDPPQVPNHDGAGVVDAVGAGVEAAWLGLRVWVGDAAIQLARWSDATVLTTVSSPEKAQLAAAAGADHVIDYRRTDVVAEVRTISPHGVDTIVEVSPATNAAIDSAVLALHGSVAMYANNGGDEVTLPIRPQMLANGRWQFVLLYTAPRLAKAFAVEDVAAA